MKQKNSDSHSIIKVAETMKDSKNQLVTVWDHWQYNARTSPNHDAIIHWVAGEEPFRWTYKSILEMADRFSAHLTAIGIKKGDVCAIIIKHNPYFYPLYMAVAGIGATPAVLAYPNPRLHPDKFRQGIEGMSQRSGLDYILTQRDIEQIISPLVTKEGSTIKSMYFPLEWDLVSPPDEKIISSLQEVRAGIRREDPFLLQHSSGTTGLQKPVLLSHRAVLEHVECYFESIQLTSEDKVVSWLPLYHDMGLIAAFHLPLAYGIPTIQIDPFEWVLAPVMLIEAATKEKGTLTWLPNFAFNFMADRIDDEEMEGLTLSTFRLIVNCSEPVRDASHIRFRERFGAYGLQEHAFSASYGMAETTFAVTQTPPDKPLVTITVDRDALANGKVIEYSGKEKPTRICVSCGKPIRGCNVKIVDENRNPLPDGVVGELAVTSLSIFDGYRNYPEKTAEVYDGEWYFTGDYGFIYHDEYYIIGRKKDIIIVAGKNIYPEDIEDAVNKVAGVLPGRVIAFGEEISELGTEQVSVVAETDLTGEDDRAQLRRAIVDTGMGIDVTIAAIYLVPPRWLIKSSAGKPSRKGNKDRLDEMKTYAV